MKKILITGGCGFLGHHLVEHYLRNSDYEIIVLDALTYASNGFDRLRDINCFDDKRIKIITYNIREPISEGIIKETGKLDYILHTAAETHVDNSIIDPLSFVKTNVLGTAHMLEFARKKADNLKNMLYFSTDEVFGPAPQKKKYKEWDRYRSTNPYAASKAGGEELCLAYANTYKLPVFITHCMNLFGERQHPEKFIPMCIKKIRDNQCVTIHANKAKTVSGSRFYIHCRNVASAVDFILPRATTAHKYNIVGEKEVSNLDMALTIAEILEKPLKYEMTDFHSQRPGHDLRYALDGSLLKELGWKIPIDFEKSLEKTVKWFINNKRWL